MYLKSIHTVNVGPIKDGKIIFPFNENNLPKPVVIVGENGMVICNSADKFRQSKIWVANKDRTHSLLSNECGRKYF